MNSFDRKKYISEAKQAIQRFKESKDNVKKKVILLTFEMKWAEQADKYTDENNDEEVDEIYTDILYLPSTVLLSKEEDQRYIMWLNKEPISSYIDKSFESAKIEYKS